MGTARAALVIRFPPDYFEWIKEHLLGRKVTIVGLEAVSHLANAGEQRATQITFVMEVPADPQAVGEIQRHLDSRPNVFPGVVITATWTVAEGSSV